MQNAEFILERIVKLVNLRSLEICTTKFIKLPILIKLLTFLLSGMIFNTHEYKQEITTLVTLARNDSCLCIIAKSQKSKKSTFNFQLSIVNCQLYSYFCV